MTSTRHLRHEATGYADDGRNAAARALESTRDFASHALESAGERMRDLRYGMKDFASRGASSMGGYAQATKVYVAEQPLKSALVAAAVGAVVAGVIIAMRRRSADRRYY